MPARHLSFEAFLSPGQEVLELWRVLIVGTNILQNELISSFLAKETGVSCIAVESLANVKFLASEALERQLLVLCDCMGKDASSYTEDFVSVFSSWPEASSCKCLVALFNLKRGEGMEEGSISNGVKGLFYEGESTENFAKGIKAVLNGELWISRKLMTEFISRNSHTIKKPKQKILSTREAEILIMLSEGASNEEIAHKLCISRYTVKTHLYNIYKKINASSRFQAALWSSKNL